MRERYPCQVTNEPYRRAACSRRTSVSIFLFESLKSGACACSKQGKPGDGALDQ